ncbi:hypothetical protein ACFSKI_20320 [Pseudogracilibacillus auburnensis]|uniref:LysM domain-containing protein n=1 Tax=Pseudogracilibacillus auburnensis TaxID=1494959 RepID=A0A2V3VY16_9BACI|nr:hypothetical protein [Pseudogracilibacillus auburnensis]PXW86506.1 hypothetical protein DFR56_10724 [Pseudogracilibacillus auburnensis]
MYYVKRICLYTCIILLILSLYNDFTKGSTSFITPNHEVETINGITVMKIKVHPGDTILSVSERINKVQVENLRIDQIMTDFQIVNPNADVHALSPNTYYYFPVY